MAQVHLTVSPLVCISGSQTLLLIKIIWGALESLGIYISAMWKIKSSTSYILQLVWRPRISILEFPHGYLVSKSVMGWIYWEATRILILVLWLIGNRSHDDGKVQEEPIDMDFPTQWWVRNGNYFEYPIKSHMCHRMGGKLIIHVYSSGILKHPGVSWHSSVRVLSVML